MWYRGKFTVEKRDSIARGRDTWESPCEHDPEPFEDVGRGRQSQETKWPGGKRVNKRPGNKMARLYREGLLGWRRLG